MLAGVEEELFGEGIGIEHIRCLVAFARRKCADHAAGVAARIGGLRWTVSARRRVDATGS